ncbi:MAG: aminodeoxychorismate lyase [Fibrobacteres bacterium]|nr:aminodeoxychorismate lyase [Fibrobacterota bacterium]
MAKKGKKGFSLSRGLALLLLLIVCTLSVVWVLTAKSIPKPYSETGLEADPVSGDVLYEVPPKASLSALSADLQAKGLIPNAMVFRAFLRFSRQDKKIRAGYFYIRPSNSTLDLAWKLTSGKMATQVVTIPEGKASWEIFSILKARFPLDTLRFDSLVHSAGFARSCDVEAPDLEGYLFPDTYVLPWKVSEKDVLKVMVKRFHTVIREFNLATPMYQKYGQRGWLTLASIVEKEAAVPTEQEPIAGVFYNRLNQGWSLGADPTVRFAVRKPTGPLFVSDLNSDSPYNTRKFTGLPPGPICNPGRGALLAALNPMRTDKMYFVAKDDGSREHFFSVDGNDHLHFKDMAASNRAKRSKGDQSKQQGKEKPASVKPKPVRVKGSP